jgi:hypothetical protein
MTLGGESADLATGETGMIGGFAITNDGYFCVTCAPGCTIDGTDSYVFGAYRAP